jgi:hypothetical protein
LETRDATRCFVVYHSRLEFLDLVGNQCARRVLASTVSWRIDEFDGNVARLSIASTQTAHPSGTSNLVCHTLEIRQLYNGYLPVI